ncbi:MAG: ribosomal L7Ae/L30e/S12e/Gadd45 family protein [Sporomusaceae bacterium]|nr:ribosomal L7Ae/L30e/S12e/Gadd45 family protein [Sporomusaceae bacterium]
MSLLGLAQRAGKALSGEFVIERAIRAGKVHCLIVAADAAENTRKKYRDMTTYYAVPCVEALSKDALSGGIGRENRAAIAITDAGMSQALKKLLSDTQ